MADDARSDPRLDLDRAALATVVREHLLAGHLIDRAGMPLLLGHVSPEVMGEVAIEEWRGASPLYTRRMQRLLGFEGDDVATIFKGMQLDVGAPPQFMDFRFVVHDHDRGEFHLDHCGALMDVEPMGEELVHIMCHAIEDPTFPATACATDPRAQVLPVHRPPRTPADRHPHCHWTVAIDPDGEPEPEPTEAERLATTLAASLPVTDPGWAPAAGDEGRWRYDGDLEADLDLASFAAPVLAAIDDEVCLQGHLLVLSFAVAAAERVGAEVAAEIARGQLAGVGSVAAQRLRDALGLGDDLAAVGRVLDLHPAFLPRSYVDLRTELDAAGEVLRVALHDGPSVHETLADSWVALLAEAPLDPGPLEAIVQGVQPRTRCRPVPADERGDALAAWDVVLVDEPAPEPDVVTLTRFSSGATFVFEDR